MKFKMIMSILVIALGSSISSANILKANTSVRCAAQDKASALTSFSFDLFATGHPMAGVGMYSGMFEAEAPGLVCRTLRGHIYSGIYNGNFRYMAYSDCLDNQEFIIDVMTSFYDLGKSYEGTLSYRTMAPFSPSVYKTVSIVCHLE